MNSNHHLPSPRYFRLMQTCCAMALVLGAGFTRASEAQDMFPAPVYVALQGSHTVQDVAQDKTLDGLPGAHYVAISADGAHMLVSSKNLPEAWLLDAHTGKKLATFEIGPTPQGVSISPNGDRGLAVSAGNGSVAVIDMRKQRLVASIAVGKVPHNVRFTENGKLAYVTLQGSGSVAVIDMPTLKKIDEFPVPGLKYPHNLDLSADGKTLWIRGLIGKVAAMDVSLHKVLAVIPVGLGHAGIDVIPGSGYVVTAAIADHLVDVIDPKTFKVIKRIDVGPGPHGLRASRNGRWIYVGVTGADKVAVIDTRSLDVVKQIPVRGKLPFWIAVAGND